MRQSRPADLLPIVTTCRQVLSPSANREQLIAAASKAIANAELRKQLPRPMSKTSLDPGRPTSTEPDSADKPAQSQHRIMRSANAMQRQQEATAGWGTDGSLLRREPGSEGSHLSYARKKATRSVPIAVKPQVSVIRPLPSSERLHSHENLAGIR